MAAASVTTTCQLPDCRVDDSDNDDSSGALVVLVCEVKVIKKVLIEAFAIFYFLLNFIRALACESIRSILNEHSNAINLILTSHLAFLISTAKMAESICLIKFSLAFLFAENHFTS